MQGQHLKSRTANQRCFFFNFLLVKTKKIRPARARGWKSRCPYLRCVRGCKWRLAPATIESQYLYLRVRDSDSSIRQHTSAYVSVCCTGESATQIAGSCGNVIFAQYKSTCFASTKVLVPTWLSERLDRGDMATSSVRPVIFLNSESAPARAAKYTHKKN